MTLLEQLEAYRLRKGLTRKALARLLGVHEDTLGHWFSKGESANSPNPASIAKVDGVLAGDKEGGVKAVQALVPPQPLKPPHLIEAQRRSQKVKYLLLLLEDELGWFRESEPEAREALRKAIPFSDVGYISSLLGMLGDEEMFRRWQTFTTYKFGRFEGR